MPEPVFSQDASAARRPWLRLHGHPRVEGTARPLTLRHGLALLARLAESREPLGRDGLVALLWPDAPPATGRGRLRRLLHQMQEQAGTELVAAEGDRLRLAPALGCDLHATRAAITTLSSCPRLGEAHWAPLLAVEAAGFVEGFRLGSDAFDEWAAQVRRLHQSALTHALERCAASALSPGGDPRQALAIADALLRLDGCNEAAHALRLQARAAQGDAAGVESAYHACASALREELGVRPSAVLEEAHARALAGLRALQPAIGYAPVGGDGGRVAHVAWGRGPRTLVALWGLVSHLEVGLEEPRARAFLDRLAGRNRVVVLDRRGTGLSERLGAMPGPEGSIQDILATLDHLGVQRTWLFGSAAGGTQALAFALRHPERVAGLVLYGASAVGWRRPDAPWGLDDDRLPRFLQSLTDPAHYVRSLRCVAPSVADDPAVQRWHARMLRQAATPHALAQIIEALRDVDLRPELRRLEAPTLVIHRRGDRLVPPEAGRQIAAAVPHAELHLLDGEDHLPWVGDADAVLAAIEGFVARAGEPAAAVA